MLGGGYSAWRKGRGWIEDLKLYRTVSNFTGNSQNRLQYEVENRASDVFYFRKNCYYAETRAISANVARRSVRTVSTQLGVGLM